LNSAVRRPPRCSAPVGLGAYRTRTGRDADELHQRLAVRSMPPGPALFSVRFRHNPVWQRRMAARAGRAAVTVVRGVEPMHILKQLHMEEAMFRVSARNWCVRRTRCCAFWCEATTLRCSGKQPRCLLRCVECVRACVCGRGGVTIHRRLAWSCDRGRVA
jgi:hypothetical protein